LIVSGTSDLVLGFDSTMTSLVFTDVDADGVGGLDDGWFRATDNLGVSMNIQNPSSSLTVNLNNLGNTVTFTDLDAAFNPTNGLTINGGSANDTIIVSDLGDTFGHNKTGALTINGGGGTDALTFQSTSVSLASLVADVETIGINVASVSTDGSQSYSGSVTLTAASAVTLSGSTVTFDGTLTGNGNNLTITGNGVFNAAVSTIGALVVTDNADINAEITNTGSVSVAGTSSIAADVTTIGTQTYTGAVTPDAASPLILAGSAVTFGTLLTGNGQNLTITGHGVFHGALSEVAALTITGNADFNAAVLDTTSLEVTGSATIGANISTTGDQTYSGAVTLDAASAVGLIGADFVFGNSLTGNNRHFTLTGDSASFASAVSGVGSGTGAGLTLNVSGAVVFSGTVAGTSGILSTNALGSTQFQQNVTLGDGDTGSSFAGSVNFDGLNWSSYDGLTLGNATTLSSGAVSLNSNGGAIAFSNTVDGTQNLTLIAGSGSISFDASVGDTDPLSSLQITSAADVTFSGTVDANALTQLAGTGTTTFSDTVILTGGLNLTGTHFSIAGRVEAGGAIAVTNTGALTTTSDGSLVSADSFAQVGTGSSSIGANITTAGDLSFASAVTLTADVALNSNNAGSISFGGTLDGAFDLTLTAGGEDVSFQGAVGASAKLADISIVSANDVTVASILKATTFTQTAGTGTTLFSGATTLDAELDYTGNNLTVNAAFTSGAAITVNNTGTFSTGTSGDIVLVGNFAQTGIGESSLGGDIATGDGTTSASSISFATAITLTADVTLSTNSGSNNGDITVSSSVTGLLSKLSLAAGTGNIQFDSAIDSVSLAGLLVSSAGQLTLNSALTVDSQGVDITAGTVSVNNTLRTLNSGMLEITNSGVLTVPTGSTFTLDGAFLQNGTGTVSLADDITTTDDDVAFTAAVTLAAAVAIDTGAGGGSIAFHSTLNGGQDLLLTAGTGNIDFDASVGLTTRLGILTIISASDFTADSSINATSILQQAGSGTTTFSSTVNTNTADGVSITGTHLQVAGLVTTTSGGLVLVNNSGTVNFSAAGDISADGTVNLTALGGIQTAGDITTTNDSVTLVSATTLTGAVTINTGSGVGDITFNGTVNGSEDLTLAAGTGNIDFNQSVGQTARLDQLRIVSLTDATFDAAVSVQNFLQNAGSDTTTFTGRLNTNTAAGINVTGTNLVFNGGITTTNAGPVTASLSATALIGPSTTSSISGPVTINSVGSITVASSASVAVSNTVLLKTTADSITFQDSAQLTGSSGNVVLEAEDNISLAGGSTIAVTSGELILRSGLSSTDGVGSMTLDGTLQAVTAGQTITLDLNDELAATQNMTTGRILAPYLRLLSNGTNAATFTLLAGTRNDVDTLAVSTSGAVSYSDADDLIIGAIATSSGIASIAGISTLNGVSEGAVVSITANNAMTVNQNIRTSPVAGPGGLNIGTVTLSSTVSTISITDNGDIYADGAVSMTAPSGIQTAGEVTTSDDNVTFNSAVTLIGAVAIDTEFGAGTITFNATVNGSEDLTLTAGTGNIDFNQSVGQTARLDQLRIVSVTDATFDAAVSAQNVLQDAGTGTTTFVGLLDTTIPAGVNLTGTNLHVVTGINTVGTGVVTVNLAGIAPRGVAEFDNNADIFADGAVTVTTTTRISTGGDVTTTNDNVTITALTVVLTQSITVDSGPGLGNILLDAGIEGTTANSQSLILDAGTGGTLTITGSIGKATALNTFTLVDSNGAEIGTLDTDYIVADTLVHIVSSEAGALVRFNGGVKTPQVNADEAGYHLQFAGSGTNVGTDMSSDYLSAILRNTGEAIFGDGNNDILLFRNGVEVFAASSVELYGSIYTHAAPVTLGDGDTPTNLRIHRSIIDTTSAGLYPMGDTITFGGVLEGGTALGNENVDLDAGTSGDIVYMDEVGGARRIGTMLIRSARNIDFPNVTAQSVLQTTGTGTNTVSGIMNTTSASGVNITTTNIVVNNLVTTIVDPLMTDSAPGIVNLQATAGTASATTGIITMLDPGRIVSSNDVTLRGNRSVAPSILVFEDTPAGANLTPTLR
ncbi:MAG: hypothetical protein ACK5EN_07330, partial [Planctomyces sp.]